jgi:hypothetical protein
MTSSPHERVFATVNGRRFERAEHGEQVVRPGDAFGRLWIGHDRVVGEAPDVLVEAALVEQLQQVGDGSLVVCRDRASLFMRG